MRVTQEPQDNVSLAVFLLHADSASQAVLVRRYLDILTWPMNFAEVLTNPGHYQLAMI